jgi:hypothetical protein
MLSVALTRKSRNRTADQIEETNSTPNFPGNKGGLVPVRRFFKFNLDIYVVFIDVVPLPVGMPTRRDHLHQNFSPRNARNLQAAVLIGLEVFFGLLIFASKESFAVRVANINAGASYRLPILSRNHGDSKPRFRRILGFFLLLGFRIRSRRLVRNTGAALARRRLILTGRRLLLRLTLRLRLPWQARCADDRGSANG